MRIASIATREITWPLDGRGAARGLAERRALLLEVRTATGTIGLGEAAPLPGTSPDTVDDAARAFAALAALAPFAVASFNDASAIASRVAAAAPAARFAIEAALGAALAEERGVSLASLLGGEGQPAIAHVVDDPDDARRAWAGGARTLKVKVGLRDSEIERVRAIAAAVPEARLRLDANRSWPRASVRARMEALSGLPIDFIEEPCRDAHQLLTDPFIFDGSRAIPIALDESLGGIDVAALARVDGLAAVVLKPTLLGLAGCLRIAELARARRIAAIASHTLEGPIGTAACAELARALATPGVAAGLGPHAALDAWSLRVPQLADPARLTASPAPGLGLGTITLGDLDPPSVADKNSAPRDAITTSVTAALRGSGSISHIADQALAAGGGLRDADRTERRDTLSIEAAARDAAEGTAIATVMAAIDFAEAARRARRVSSATRGGGGVPRARVVVAQPSVETISAVHAALEGGWPIALLHAKLPPDELERQRELVSRAQLPEGTAAVLFTSGSSGPARAVAIGRDAVRAAVEANAAHLGWRAGDRWLCALSLAHAGGLAIAVRCLAARAPLVLIERDGEREAPTMTVARALDEQRCTIASLVPSQLAALLEDPSWRPPVHLRAVLLGGAAAPQALLEAAAARGVPFLVTYGMTEALGQVATADPSRAGDPTARPRALPGVEIEGGTADAPARLRVRAPMLATCYLGSAVAVGDDPRTGRPTDAAGIIVRRASVRSAGAVGDDPRTGRPTDAADIIVRRASLRSAGAREAIAPELTTGDLGHVDPDGTVHVAGRADDVIVSGGAKVHPSTIEAIVAAGPGVRAACVFGIADARWGHVVGLAIAADPTFDAASAFARWHASLPPHARPRELAVADTLPLLATGKPDRRAASRLPRTPVRYR